MDGDFRIGQWVVRPKRLCICLKGKTNHVTPKSMAVLECLASAQGEVVSRNDILDTVWPGAEVTDDVLTHSVTELRKAFGDSPQHSGVIETIPKKGLRLMLEVSSVDGTAEQQGDKTIPAPLRSVPRAFQYGLLGAVIVLIALAGWPLLSGRDAGVPPGAAKSIAVLPFVDKSQNTEQQYLADSLSEELAVQLSRMEGLSVFGPRSVLLFVGDGRDVRVGVERLAPNFVIDGSIRPADGQLRITAQLIDVREGNLIWTHSLDRELSEIAETLNTISRAYAQALGYVLDIDQDPTFAGTDDPDAIIELVRGHEHLDLTAEGMTKARRHFLRATAIDPDYGLAWQQVAMAHNARTFESALPWQRENRRIAEHAIARALELQPDFVDTLLVASEVHFNGQNWSEARRYYDRAVARGAIRDQDVYALVREMHVHTNMLFKLGYVEEQIELLEDVHRLRPLRGPYSGFLPQAYLAAGRYIAALQEAERAYREPGAHFSVSEPALNVALSVNDTELIRLWLERVIESWPPEGSGLLASMLDTLGDPKSAIARLRAAFDRSPEYDHTISVWSSYYGDHELALTAMRRSPDLWYFWIPLLAPLRETEEFKSIVSDMGLVDYWREYGWNDYCSPVGETDFECR